MKLNGFRQIGGKIARIRFAIGAMLVGLIFLVLGAFVMLNSNKDSQYAPTEATITEVIGVSDIDETKYDVSISYMVDSNEYSGSTISDKNTVGATFTIYYDVEDPQNFSTDANGGKFLPIVILAIGSIALAGGIVFLIMGIKDKGNQLEQVDMSKHSQEEIDAVANNNEETKKYFFHFEGKLNQSYILETEDRKPIVTIHCDKIAVVGKFKFTFTNNLTGSSKTYEVSHTVTHSTGGYGFMIPNKSSFKLDGKDVFKIIGDMGYSIISKIEGIRLNFDICHLGINVASLRSSGTNAIDGNKNHGKLGDIPTPGVFSVEAKESDLDAVALIAFAVSRVEFF